MPALDKALRPVDDEQATDRRLKAERPIQNLSSSAWNMTRPVFSASPLDHARGDASHRCRRCLTAGQQHRSPAPMWIPSIWMISRSRLDMVGRPSIASCVLPTTPRTLARTAKTWTPPLRSDAGTSPCRQAANGFRRLEGASSNVPIQRAALSGPSCQQVTPTTADLEQLGRGPRRRGGQRTRGLLDLDLANMEAGHSPWSCPIWYINRSTQNVLDS